jgi:hypothetical protein
MVRTVHDAACPGSRRWVLCDFAASLISQAQPTPALELEPANAA